MEKPHQVVWDSLTNHDRLEWLCTLQDLENALDIAYEDVFRDFDKGRCVKSPLLLVTI